MDDFETFDGMDQEQEGEQDVFSTVGSDASVAAAVPGLLSEWNDLVGWPTTRSAVNEGLLPWENALPQLELVLPVVAGDEDDAPAANAERRDYASAPDMTAPQFDLPPVSIIEAPVAVEVLAAVNDEQPVAEAIIPVVVQALAAVSDEKPPVEANIVVADLYEMLTVSDGGEQPVVEPNVHTVAHVHEEGVTMQNSEPRNQVERIFEEPRQLLARLKETVDSWQASSEAALLERAVERIVARVVDHASENRNSESRVSERTGSERPASHPAVSEAPVSHTPASETHIAATTTSETPHTHIATSRQTARRKESHAESQTTTHAAAPGASHNDTHEHEQTPNLRPAQYAKSVTITPPLKRDLAKAAPAGRAAVSRALRGLPAAKDRIQNVVPRLVGTADGGDDDATTREAPVPSRLHKPQLREMLGAELALAALLSAAAIARDTSMAQKKEQKDQAKQVELAKQSATTADLMEDDDAAIARAMGASNRERYTVYAGDTLVRIAENVYGDAQLAYLIAEINVCVTKQVEDDGRLLVTVKAGQSIELPNWSDLQMYYGNLTKQQRAASVRIVTIVETNALQHDALKSLAPAMGY